MNLTPGAGCEHLDEWADDPEMPIAREPAGGYLLRLSDDRVICSPHCPFCGGNGWPRDNSPRCGCGELDALARSGTAPIHFDPECDEYTLLVGRSYVVLNYCPMCGGRLRPSRRPAAAGVDEVFDRLRSRLTGAPTLEDVAERFGPPDHRGTVTIEEFSGDQLILPALYYRALEPGVSVTFHQKPSGGVSFSIARGRAESALDRAGYRWRGRW